MIRRRQHWFQSCSGPTPLLARLGQTIAERAAGNPFFAEEIVRELAERGVLRGERGRIHLDRRGR